MLYQDKAKFFLAFFISLVLLPFSVSAIVFNPDADMNINLKNDSILNFDSFSIQKGVSINYSAPEKSAVNIVSEGDIDIAGTLNILNNSSLSLTSKQGNINLTGSIMGSGLYLTGHESINLSGSINTADFLNINTSGIVTLGNEPALKAPEGKVNYSGLTVSSGGKHILTPVQILPKPSYYVNSASSITQVISPALVQLPTPIPQVFSLALVPLPAPIWLFGSSLLLLIGCKKKGGKDCAALM